METSRLRATNFDQASPMLRELRREIEHGLRFRTTGSFFQPSTIMPQVTPASAGDDDDGQ